MDPNVFIKKVNTPIDQRTFFDRLQRSKKASANNLKAIRSQRPDGFKAYWD